MDCTFKPLGYVNERGRYALRCRRCQRKWFARYEDPKLCHRGCIGGRVGWGDRLQRLLTLIGVTRENYLALRLRIRRIFGVAHVPLVVCGCGKRQEKLNEVGFIVADLIGPAWTWPTRFKAAVHSAVVRFVCPSCR